MEIKTTIPAGQNGTKQLTNKYGHHLICVRYRYNNQTQYRQKPHKTGHHHRPTFFGRVRRQNKIFIYTYKSKPSEIHDNINRRRKETTY